MCRRGGRDEERRPNDINSPRRSCTPEIHPVEGNATKKREIRNTRNSIYQKPLRLLVSQAQQEASALSAFLAIVTGQIRDVGVVGERRRDLLAGVDTTDLNQATAGLGNGLADNISTLGFTLGADDIGLTFLLGSLDDETGPLGVLLGDLLLLDGACEFLSEGHVGDGDVLEGDVELRGSLHEVCADAVGDSFTLGDQLGGIELGDNGFEDFVSDGWQHTFIIVDTVGLFGRVMVRGIGLS